MNQYDKEEMRKVCDCVSRWSDDDLSLVVKSNALELHTYSGSMNDILLMQNILDKDHPIIIVHTGTLHIEYSATVHTLIYVADSLTNKK